jgi:hypothetical protein
MIKIIILIVSIITFVINLIIGLTTKNTSIGFHYVLIFSIMSTIISASFLIYEESSNTSRKLLTQKVNDLKREIEELKSKENNNKKDE